MNPALATSFRASNSRSSVTTSRRTCTVLHHVCFVLGNFRDTTKVRKVPFAKGDSGVPLARGERIVVPVPFIFEPEQKIKRNAVAEFPRSVVQGAGMLRAAPQRLRPCKISAICVTAHLVSR
ncbi:hypothetical protein E1B28_009471 [Marasmius oreades]|uniref:Uncharacterized protein n=1 Tax=Marasmius oreades TaxID=181124 RepID=A0A9P7RW94_9AGAR|nr:uncharacterized protein E1B28_009471 [Marasmius oreades]KAG7090351.1 hypothetical protein E1B28_009471 [Marasmius oreades]